MDRTQLIAKFGEPQRVLDHGRVWLVDVMGDDARIAEVARVSYQRGTGRRRPDEHLLRYLLRHRHTSPFEQCVVTIGMKMPIFVARQFVRHRTQSINEVSARYSVLPAEFYVPDPEQVCHQSKRNKQGRAEPLTPEEAEAFRAYGIRVSEDMFAGYAQWLDQDTARETARMYLPLATYTEWVFTINLHNMMHLLSLRMDPHAQWETRQFANQLAEIVKAWCPIAWEAFEDYTLYAVRFSRMEWAVIRAALLRDGPPEALAEVLAKTQVVTPGEVEEFLAKLRA